MAARKKSPAEEDGGSVACLAGKRSPSTTTKERRVEKARQGNGFNLKWNSLTRSGEF